MVKPLSYRPGIRIGPITILVFVIILCIAVLATLAVATAHANTASTERQIAFTNDVYANEAAAQTMLSYVDIAAIDGPQGVREKLPSIVARTKAAAKPNTASITFSGNTLNAVFETESGRQLLVELTLDNTGYSITKWKTSTNWKEENTEKLWVG